VLGGLYCSIMGKNKKKKAMEKSIEHKVEQKIEHKAETSGVVKSKKSKKKSGKGHDRYPMFGKPANGADGMFRQNAQSYVEAIGNPFAAGGIRIPDFGFVPTFTNQVRKRYHLVPVTVASGEKMIGFIMTPNDVWSYLVIDATSADSAHLVWDRNDVGNVGNPTRMRTVSCGFHLTYGGLPQSKYVPLYCGMYLQSTNSQATNLYSLASTVATTEINISSELAVSSHYWCPWTMQHVIQRQAANDTEFQTATAWRTPNTENLYDNCVFIVGLVNAASTDEMFVDMVWNFELLPANFTSNAFPLEVVPGSTGDVEIAMTDALISKGRNPFKDVVSGVVDNDNPGKDWLDNAIDVGKGLVKGWNTVGQIIGQSPIAGFVDVIGMLVGGLGQLGPKMAKVLDGIDTTQEEIEEYEHLLALGKQEDSAYFKKKILALERRLLVEEKEYVRPPSPAVSLRSIAGNSALSSFGLRR